MTSRRDPPAGGGGDSRSSTGGPSRAPQRPSPSLRSPSLWAWIVVLLLANIIIASLVGRSSGPSRVEIPYTTFKQEVAKDKVPNITTTGDTIDGHATEQLTSADGSQRSNDFTTTRPAYDDPSLEALLEAHKVRVTAQSPSSSWLLSVLIGFGPVLLLVAAFVYLMRRQTAAAGGGGLFGMGRSRARLYNAEKPGVTFADVAGVDEAKAELAEVVDFLEDPAKYQRLGGTMPKGVLLIGPPGTGKTLLARAVAGEAGVPFFSVAASEFVEMIVGVGAARVRDLFSKARAAAPAIIFIDELDAIGRSRGAAVRIGGHDEQEQTLNQILTEMDGFDSREGVIVLAATNRPDVLDIALLRPGRFDRRVPLEPPDRAGRAAILRIHASNVPLADDVDLDEVAAMTTGMVGADLRNLINEAALLAARRGRPAVIATDIDEAFEKVLLGAERHIVMSAEDRRRTAYHEAGHALLGLLIPGADRVRKVSIIPRGRALGATVQRPVDDRQNYPESYLRARITSALGGRAAEMVVYGEVTTGAEDDLRQVTHLAHEMVVRFGMSPKVGALQYTEEGDGAVPVLRARTYSDATARLIDNEVKRIVDECLERACSLLGANRARLDSLTEALLGAEHLEEDEIARAAGLEVAAVEPDRRPAAGQSPRGAATTAAMVAPAVDSLWPAPTGGTNGPL